MRGQTGLAPFFLLRGEDQIMLPGGGVTNEKRLEDHRICYRGGWPIFADAKIAEAVFFCKAGHDASVQKMAISRSLRSKAFSTPSQQ
jgi:hypothetical protein